jgi:hypothetical protein
VAREALDSEKLAITERLVKAVSHPIRLKACTILGERVASPNEIAKTTGEDLGLVAYHVRELEKLGWAELVKTEPRRGALEHFYRGTARPLLDDAKWSRLTPEQRDEYSAVGIQIMFVEAGWALAEGTFDSRLDRHMTRSPMQVDERGWKEVAKTLEAAFARVQEIQEACVSRVADEEVETFPVTVDLIAFERPKAP